MNLAFDNLRNIHDHEVVLPSRSILQLPIKIIQFGTGALLRGLPDYFVDKANREGIFNGRIVAIKSTNRGPLSEFDKQNGLYTLAIRGIENRRPFCQNIICSAINEVLPASAHWKNILSLAGNPDLKIIFSNTTEVGINFSEDDIFHSQPYSFPGKLLSFLYERYLHLHGRGNYPIIIVPTELIPDNGEKLKQIINDLVIYNKINDSFSDWLNHEVYFCNSLVDRIVPGRPDSLFLNDFEREHGYHDELMIIAEPYACWAIEGDEFISSVLSFSRADKRVIITRDIRRFHDIKLSLLNGVHTLTCGISLLAGIRTVKEAMDSPVLSRYVRKLMFDEIIPAMPENIHKSEAIDFAKDTLDRFGNPYITHKWHDITKEYTSKVRTRVIPLLICYFELRHTLPENITFGFTAYIYFMSMILKKGNEYYIDINGADYLITDQYSDYFFELSNRYRSDHASLIEELLKNADLWGKDLTAISGLSHLLNKEIRDILANGYLKALTLYVGDGNKKY